MNRTARWLLAIALAQAALLGVYGLVEHRRAAEIAEPFGTEPPQRIDRVMPSLTTRRRDGTTLKLPSHPRRTLVHIWATWCPPCRTELPGLLDVQAKHGVEVVAIALDRSWGDIDRFLGDVRSSSLVLAGSQEVERALGVRSLPVTFLMEADGRLALRFDGARNWTDEGFVSSYVGAHQPGPRPQP